MQNTDHMLCESRGCQPHPNCLQLANYAQETIKLPSMWQLRIKYSSKPLQAAQAQLVGMH
jgi:hypothetical protein